MIPYLSRRRLPAKAFARRVPSKRTFSEPGVSAEETSCRHQHYALGTTRRNLVVVSEKWTTFPRYSTDPSGRTLDKCSTDPCSLNFLTGITRLLIWWSYLSPISTRGRTHYALPPSPRVTPPRMTPTLVAPAYSEVETDLPDPTPSLSDPSGWVDTSVRHL